MALSPSLQIHAFLSCGTSCADSSLLPRVSALQLKRDPQSGVDPASFVSTVLVLSYHAAHCECQLGPSASGAMQGRKLPVLGNARLSHLRCTHNCKRRHSTWKGSSLDVHHTPYTRHPTPPPTIAPSPSNHAATQSSSGTQRPLHGPNHFDKHSCRLVPRWGQ